MRKFWSLPRLVAREEQGVILLYTVLFTTLGTIITAALMAMVGGNVRGVKSFIERDKVYYAAQAAMEFALADGLQGIDLMASSYDPPALILNGEEARVRVYRPNGAYRPKMVARYLDPGVGLFTSLPSGEEHVVTLEGVEPFSLMAVNWAFTGQANVRISVLDDQGFTIASFAGETQSSRLLSARLGVSKTYRVYFRNEGSALIETRPFNSSGGSDKTWIAGTLSGREYVITSEVIGKKTLKAYVRQMPGPSQTSQIPQTIVVETWLVGQGEPLAVELPSNPGP